MTVRATLVLFSCIACATTTFAQTSTSARKARSGGSTAVYDNFNEKFLDPLRWNLSSSCFAGSGLEMECVREIQAGQLRLAHRNFGQRDSDVGFQFGSDTLTLASPASITNITTDLVVRDVEEVSCLTNPQLGGAASVDGTFFNTGTGNSNDDVGGHLVFGRVFTDPKGQITVFGQINQGPNFFGYTSLGTVQVGIRITASLQWDQTNHQFLLSWINRVTGVKTEGTMSYSLSDNAPPTAPYGALNISTFPANCTANQTWVYIESDFDNVRIAK
jgi:hypothetical protein